MRAEQQAVNTNLFFGRLVAFIHTSPRFALREVTWLVSLTCHVCGLHAQTASAPLTGSLQTAAASLKEVVISGSRSERALEDLPMTIEVVVAKDIEDGPVRDIRDAAKNISNVSVRRAPARFGVTQGATGREGNAGFNIRGLEGNRVLMLVDGIRIPRSYSFGVNAFGRDALSIDLVKRIEVVKGPASALYGSDGVAGLVNFITYEPSDFLTDGKTLGGRASIRYSGDDKGRAASGTVAGRVNDRLEWQVTAASNRAEALSNLGSNDSAGPNRTTPNPQRDLGHALMAKVVFQPTADQKHVLTFEHVDKRSDYELLTARAVPVVAATSVLRADAFTTMDRHRLTWNARLNVEAAFADHLQTVLSLQDATSREYAFEDRNTSADRARDTFYRERTLQASLQGDKTLRMSSGWVQKITYGLDHTAAKVTTIQTGITPPAGETFPLKRFPDTTEASTALYVQDELMAGDWSFMPGVRLDRFSIDAAQTGFPVPAVSLAGSAVSPKWGVLWRATPQWSLFGNYASGFRAPNAGQVNAFFENVTQFYKTVPNAALKPEKSQNLEFGARARFDQLTLDTAMFYGKFNNLIQDNVQVAGNGTALSPTVFQSINVDKATISGFEVRGVMNWGPWGGGKFSTPFSYGQTNGMVTNTGKPLDSVDPAKLAVGVRFETAVWDLRLDASRHSAKNFSEIGTQLVGTPPTPQFAVPAATTLDLGGQWRIHKALRLNASIGNLTNQKYWNWSDVRTIAANSSVLDAYTQPGRKFNVSLVADF